MKTLKKIISLLLITLVMGTSANATPLPEIIGVNNYLEVTPTNEDYFKSQLKSTKIDKATGLSYDEIINLYNEYTLQSRNSISSEISAKENINNFAQYAVERGIIPNTPQAVQGFTVAFLRAQFNIGADLGEAMGCPNAANFLRHSLQDNPVNVSFASGTLESNWIKNSVEFKNIVDAFHTYVKGKNLSARTTSGSTTLNSTSDLHLALNKVSYVASGTKSNGVWNLTITFKDVYNFEKAAWGEMGGELATIVNNYAVIAQEQGAIVPYDISIAVKGSFVE